jgi:hypothetical protein
MKTLLPLATAATLLLSPSDLLANKKSPPLPAIVFTGKTIFIENETGDATRQHAVYLELVRWGRFDVVASRDKADMVITISGPNTVRAVVTSDSSGGYPPPSAAPEGESVPAGFTRISIVDPKTNKAIWFSQRKTDLSKSRTGLLDGLRDAMEQQESRKRK